MQVQQQQQQKNYLENYLIAQSFNNQGATLPFFHTCPLDQARDYIKEKKLFPRHCDVFNEELVYLFLGRAEYRDYKALNLNSVKPIGFAINPAKLPNPKRIYPFDTGGVAEEKYGEIFEKAQLEEVKKQFCIGDKIEHAYTLIGIIYGSPLRYVIQQALETINYDTEVEIEMNSIKKIHTLDYKQPDNRKATIEVQLKDEVPFVKDVLLAIFTPGVAIANYKTLRDLVDELEIPIRIKPDREALIEKSKNVQDCYSQIRDDSIQLSCSICDEK